MNQSNNIPTIKPNNLEGEDVWFADIAWRNGRSDQVGAFRTKSETEDWIAHRSSAWLAGYERRRRTLE
jgi:hypothetical protein